MLKKLFIFLFAIFVATDSFATTDIAANAENSTCNDTVLGTTEGDVNFDAKWESNNIQLIWHDNNTIIQNATNTCNYDGTLTIPTPEPQRVGYTFDGWHVMPTINAGELTSLSTGSEVWAHGYYQRDYYWHASGTADATESTIAAYPQFTKLEKNEWRVDYRSGTTKGTLYGTGYCSGKSGNHSDYTWPASDSSNWLSTYTDLKEATGTKKYCWCQTTGWVANGSDTLQALSSLSLTKTWIFNFGHVSAAACNYGCAMRCAEYVLRNSEFRKVSFGTAR